MGAVLFDMDGVIANTQDLHGATESRLLAEHGVLLSANEIAKRYAGVSDKEFFPRVFADADTPLSEPETLIRKKWDILLATDPNNIHPMPGAVELITELFGRSVPLAVASASRMSFIELVLTSLHIRNMFSALVSAEEVEHGKPAPDIFLLAAQKLGVAPKVCTVIEDGLSGMRGAKNAGMKCVALLTYVRAEDSPADINVYDLRELAVDALV